MAYISNISLYRDIGYTQDSQFVSSGTLPSPDLVIDEPIHPNQDRLFTQLRLKQVFSECFDCQYARIVYEFSNGTAVYYFWITNASVLYDADNPITVIDIQMDLWRTFIHGASLGFGIVKARPYRSTAKDPIQPIYPRWYEYTAVQELVPYRGISDYPIIWYFVAYNSNSERRLMCIPCVKDNFHDFAVKGIVDGTAESYYFPKLYDIMRDGALARYGIVPSSVTYAGFSPVPPCPVTITKESVTIYVVSIPNLYADTSIRKTDGGSNIYIEVGAIRPVTMEIPTIEPTLLGQEMFTLNDMTGAPIWTMPYGRSADHVAMRPIIGDSSGYVGIWFYFGDTQPTVSGTLPFTGMDCVIPLTPVSINSNAWSEYLYSGQRSYDLEQRRIANEKSAISGITGAVTGGVSSGTVGALGGKGITSALVNTSVGLVATGVNYSADVKYADQLQKAEDQLQQSQISTVLVPGDSFDWVDNASPITIWKRVPEPYSLERFQSHIKWNGVQCDEPRESCNLLVRESGPLRIVNLQIGGDIPVQAKQFIRDRLAQGIYIL